MRIARDSVALFRKREFTFLMGAQWLAQAADGLVIAAMAKTIAFGGQAGFDPDQARTPEEAFRIVLFTFVPFLVLSPLLGVLIDRWDRRRLLIAANGIRTVVLAAVAALGLSTTGDAALYGTLLLVLGSTRLVLAIKGAGLPAAVGEDNLIQGNAISQAGSAIFQLGGAGVALVASGVVGTRLIVAGAVVVYALATLSASGARRLGYPREVVPILRELGRILRDLAQGVREVARRPPAGLALGSFLAVRSLATVTALSISFAARGFIAEEGALVTALVGAAGALGAVAGFVAAHALKDRVGPPSMITGALVVGGAVVAAFGGIITLAALSAVAFAVGLSFFLGKVAVDTLMQRALADRFRGRGFSLQDVVYNLSWILPSLLLVLLYSGLGVRTLLIGAGAVFVVVALLLGAWARGIAGRRPEPEPAAASAQPE